MSGSYLPDLHFEPPSSWTDAPLFVARSENPDKQNNNLKLHLVSPPDQQKLSQISVDQDHFYRKAWRLQPTRGFCS